MSNSVEVAPLLVRKRSGFFSGLPSWQGAALLLLLALLYADVLAHLVSQWYHDQSTWGHGFFVPVFALFVLWKNRNELKAIERAPNWTGLWLVGCGLAMLALGDYAAEIFLERVSLLVLLAGLTILFHGWPFFRAVFFPWAFLFLMIPIPVILFQKVTFPLQILASKLASAVLPVLGVVVHREGNIMALAAKQLNIVQACSGIRSLLILLTLSIIYGYLMENRKWVRVLLAIASLPIAIIANTFRIVVTALLVQYWNPDKAEGFVHSFEGWLIFVVSLTMLFALHSLITRLWKGPEGQAPRRESPVVADAPASSAALVKTTLVRFVLVALMMSATALLLRARSGSEVFPPRAPLSSLPAQMGEWVGNDIPIDQQTLDILGAGEFLNRSYAKPAEPQNWVELFMAYFPSQRTGDTIHTPNHCLLGLGWVPLRREVIQLTHPDGTSFPANRAIWATSGAGERNLVIYWFQAHDRVVASEYLSKYYLAADAIRMNRSDGALVRLITPMYPGETPDAAQARILGLGNQIIPQLNRYIPR